MFKCTFFFFFLVFFLKPTKNIKILTFITSSNYEIFNNFLKNLKKFNMESYLHVFTTDPSFGNISKVKNISFTFLNISSIVNVEAQNYGSKTWNKINLIKCSIFSDALLSFDEFIYSDPDVILLKNFILPLKIACKTDICFQSDNPENIIKKNIYNAGFFYAKKTVFSVSFFEKWKKSCLMSEGENEDDQIILNNIVQKNYFKTNIQILDRLIFANGIFNNFFEKCKTELFPNLLTLHNNWIVGKNKKILRAKLCGYWF